MILGPPAGNRTQPVLQSRAYRAYKTPRAPYTSGGLLQVASLGQIFGSFIRYRMFSETTTPILSS